MKLINGLLYRIVTFLALATPLAGVNAANGIALYDYEVLDKKPQSRDNFVQGLQIVDGNLYVSTGLYGESRVLRYDLNTMELLDSQSLGEQFFGEGLTVMGDRIYQLTWRKKRLLIYQRENLKLIGGWPISGQGWGLTDNDQHLIYSDGSDKLYFLSPESGQTIKTLHVTRNGAPLARLNELEWIDSKIWANVWRSNSLFVIDPDSGHVTAEIDLKGLLPPEEKQRDTDVLNGIARDPASGDLWVTGKRWPWLYKIRPVPRKASTPDH